ncbi:Uncharacterised protein at_DN2273 [Pycnogonum litorale]
MGVGIVHIFLFSVASCAIDSTFIDSELVGVHYDQHRNVQSILEDFYRVRQNNLETVKKVLVRLKEFRKERQNCQPDRSEFVKSPVNSFRLLHQLVRDYDDVKDILYGSNYSDYLIRIKPVLTRSKGDGGDGAEEQILPNISVTEIYETGKRFYWQENYIDCVLHMTKAYKLLEVGDKELASKILDHLAFCYYKLDEYEDALKYAYMLSKIDPENERQEQYRSSFESLVPAEVMLKLRSQHGIEDLKISSVKQKMDKAKAKYRNGNYAGCIQILSQVVDTEYVKGNSTIKFDLLDYLAHSYYMTGDIENSLKYTAQLLDIDPKNSRIISNRRLYLGNFPKGDTGVRDGDGVKLASGNEELLRGTRAYEKQQNYICIHLLTDVLRQYKNPEMRNKIMMMISECQYKIGNLTTAIEYVVKVLDEDPSHQEALKNKERYEQEMTSDFIENIAQSFFSFATNALSN